MRSSLLAGALAAACVAAPSDDGGGTTTAASTSTTTSADTSGSTSGGTTGTSLDTTSETTSMTTTLTTTAAETAPPPDKPCSLEAIDPTIDPAMAIDAGDGEGQIPTVIGDVLVRNCGCHYTDTVPLGYIDYMSDKQKLRTFADFHANFVGTFPANYQDMPAYKAVEQRVVYHNPLPMPEVGCTVDGEPGTITMADQQTFADWFAADAPDGASWP